jgi:hypothetical protein
MGVEGVELLSAWQNSGSDGVERESAQDEHDRKQAEKAAQIRERQIRLGHIPAPEEESESEDEQE